MTYFVRELHHLSSRAAQLFFQSLALILMLAVHILQAGLHSGWAVAGKGSRAGKWNQGRKWNQEIEAGLESGNRSRIGLRK